LDILQCEKAGLVTVEISMDERKLNNFKDFMKSLYMLNPENNVDQYNVLRRETINMLVDQLLLKEIISELRAEIKEEAESFVIARCKESYKQTLMTGPFTTKGLGMQGDL
jgi:transcriptional accessory protein Tex/SPT6